MKLIRRKKRELKPTVQSLLDRVEDSVSTFSVPIYTADRVNIDERYLVLPVDITDVTSRELGRYMNALTQQKAYMRTVQGQLELLLEDARIAYYGKSQPLYAKYSAAKYTETAKERLIVTDQNIKHQYEKYAFEKARVNTVAIAIANLEDLFSLVSREVTRRGADIPDDTRAYNVTRK
jgi:hypothetical protein